MIYEKIMKQLKSFDFTDAQRKKLASIILKLDKEKQDILISGDNIATINGQSLLNGGNISIIKTGIFSIVTKLPINDIDKDKIYLVPSTKTDNENRFSEYIYTDNGWEKLGTITAEVNLSNYVQHTDVVTDTTNGLMLASDKQTVDSLPQYILGGTPLYEPNEIFAISFSKQNIDIRCACKKIDTNDDAAAIFNIPSATQSKAGVMSSSDKVKLDGIKAGAQVNKIESVSVNGTPLEITNKGVDIPIHEYTAGDGIKLENGKFSLDLQPDNFSSAPIVFGGELAADLPIRKDGKLYDRITIYNIASLSDEFGNLGLLSKSDYNAFNAKQDALTEVQLNNINNAITSISINNIGQVNTNGTVNLTIPNASITENGLMSKEDKAKLDSQPTIKASDATGVTDDDYVVIKKSELDSILSRLSALENKA